jgi:hypothetical protein
MSHGENIHWAKVSSSHAQGAAVMKGFFVEAKKYLQNLVSLILPMLMPSATAPSLSAPPAVDPAPAEVV